MKEYESAEAVRLCEGAGSSLIGALVDINNLRAMVGRGDGGRELALAATKIEEAIHWLKDAEVNVLADVPDTRPVQRWRDRSFMCACGQRHVFDV